MHTHALSLSSALLFVVLVVLMHINIVEQYARAKGTNNECNVK